MLQDIDTVTPPFARTSRPPAHSAADPATEGVSLHALTRAQRCGHALLAVLWLVVVVRFWGFWLGQQGTLALYIPATVCLFYLSTALPTFFWFFVGRMRRPADVEPRTGLRVAMITLCVPSHEAIDIIEKQLRALKDVRYPHDSWVLDEGADPRIERLAATLGVRYFTRRGRASYNQPAPPFMAKTKAGNVNAWLHHVALTGQDYDCFVQLDIDHHPTPEYLDRTLGHFRDPNVAWVQAPSVCGNLDSWTARGQAEQDLVLQGPLQMGFYGHSRTPFIIGSHTTYRTAAVREINGFQPTRAEDHLDTVVLSAAGYTGVYVPEIIATGDGPEDLGTYLGQQFAWAYSMVQILVGHTPRLIRRYGPGKAFQFLMAQTWYPLWSLSLGILWMLPVVALLVNRPITTVSLPQFLLNYGTLVLTGCLLWVAARPWFHPTGLSLSWRSLVLEIARWPIVLWAFINVVLRIKRPYMITPKGNHHAALPRAARLYGPSLTLALLGGIAMLVFDTAIGRASAEGYLVLVLFNVITTLVFLLVALGLELRAHAEQVRSAGTALVARGGVIGAVAGASALTGFAAWASWGQMLAAVG